MTWEPGWHGGKTLALAPLVLRPGVFTGLPFHPFAIVLTWYLQDIVYLFLNEVQG